MRISKNSVVSVTYSILNSAGEILERSDLPISYLQGSEKGLFLKIENALEGRQAGDTVDVTLSPEEGFGPHLPELTFTDDVDNVPPQFHQIGAEVEFQNEHGDVKTFIVSKIEDGKLTVDGNHPLAGKTITFHVEVTAVREATPQEVLQQEPLDASLSHGTLH